MRFLSRKKLLNRKFNERKKRNISFYFHQELRFKQEIDNYIWFGSTIFDVRFNGFLKFYL